jgi:hypothetical protein
MKVAVWAAEANLEAGVATAAEAVCNNHGKPHGTAVRLQPRTATATTRGDED